MAIGARSQAARTYLEKFLDDLPETELEELVKHGLRALRDTLPNEVSASLRIARLNIHGPYMKCLFCSHLSSLIPNLAYFSKSIKEEI